MVENDAPKCSKCGYEFTGLPVVGRCPECGQPYNLATKRGVVRPPDVQIRADRLLRRIRTIFLALLAAMALLCGGVMQKFVPTGRAFGVMSLVAAVMALLALTSYVYEKD